LFATDQLEQAMLAADSHCQKSDIQLNYSMSVAAQESDNGPPQLFWNERPLFNFLGVGE
jgi:hypothetical protein